MIRPVCSADAAAIAAIYNYYVLETVISFETEAVTEAQMRERLLHGSVPCLVWEENGQVVGYAYAHPWKERAAYRFTWESTIYLHPEWQGRGIGRCLMDALIPRCREAGCKSLIACITRENEASCAFHRGLGFRQVSCFPQVGFKCGRWLDVVDYQLEL